MGYLPNRAPEQDLAGVLAPSRGNDFNGNPVPGSLRPLGGGLWPWLLLATLLAFSVPLWNTARSGKQASLEGYHALMTKYSGPNAIDCGLTKVPWPPTPTVPTVCLRNAHADGQPFRIHFAWDAFGHGHTTWVGFAADGKGRLWRILYTADASEGYLDTPQATLRIERCMGTRVPRGPQDC